MKDSEIFDRYEKYVRRLSLAELESIHNDIDRENHPDRFKIVSDELKERWDKEGIEKRKIDDDSAKDAYSDKAIGLILVLGLLGLEIYLGEEKYVGTPIPQLIRLSLIFSIGLIGAFFYVQGR